MNFYIRYGSSCRTNKRDNLVYFSVNLCCCSICLKAIKRTTRMCLETYNFITLSQIVCLINTHISTCLHLTLTEYISNQYAHFDKPDVTVRYGKSINFIAFLGGVPRKAEWPKGQIPKGRIPKRPNGSKGRIPKRPNG